MYGTCPSRSHKRRTVRVRNESPKRDCRKNRRKNNPRAQNSPSGFSVATVPLFSPNQVCVNRLRSQLKLNIPQEVRPVKNFSAHRTCLTPPFQRFYAIAVPACLLPMLRAACTGRPYDVGCNHLVGVLGFRNGQGTRRKEPASARFDARVAWSLCRNPHGCHRSASGGSASALSPSNEYRDRF